MTTTNSPAMEALEYIAENFSEDVPDDVYEKADACYDTIRDHIAKLEAEDAILHAANAEFSQAAIESHAEVLRLRNELEAARKALKPFSDALDWWKSKEPDQEILYGKSIGESLTFGDLRRAASLIEKLEGIKE